MKLFTIAAALLAALSATAQSHIDDLRQRLLSRDKDYVFVVAHRGDWRSAPENSVGAIKSAADKGADMVEIDIHKTKDGQFVLMHDGNIDRTTNGHGNISDMTLEQLKSYRLRYSDGNLSDETIPTLEEALLACKDRVLVNIDKGHDYLAEISPIIQKTGTEDHVVLKGSNSVADVKNKLAGYENIIFMPVVNLENSSASGYVSSFLTEYGPAAIEVQFSKDNVAGMSLIPTIVDSGCRVWVNTLWESLCGGHEDEKAMRDPDANWGWVLDRGVTIIQTDRIAELINYLKSKGLRGEEATQPVVSPRFASFEKAGEMQRLSNGAGAWGDYNNDGNLDLLCIGCNINDGWKDVAYIYENQGNGEFVRHDNPIAGARESAVAWIDFDNDGNLDIITCGARSGNRSNAATRLFRNKGEDGGYAFEEVKGTGMEGISNESEKCYHYIAVADFDNDGWQDILITGQNSSGTRRTSLYRNEAGSGHFTLMDKAAEGNRVLRPLSSGCVSFADMNGDGYQDILVSGYGDKFNTYPQQTGTYYIYTNNGDGTFSETGSGDEWGTFLGTCVWADVNSDGHADFIITGKHRNASNQDINQGKFYINNGDGTFRLVRSAEANVEGVNTAGVDFADVNNDGLLDMVIAGNGTTSNGRTWIYINEGNVRFAPDAVTVNKVRNATVALGDYDNDGRVDLFQCGYRDGNGAGSIAEMWHNTSAYDANNAPGLPGNLSAIIEGNKVKFSWTAATDDTTPPAALRYNLYVRDKESGLTAMVVPADIVTGRLRTGEMTQALYTTSYEMTLPAADKEYEWGVQAIDTAKSGGKFATGSFATSGVAAVEADGEVEAKYYNISGIEVKNPAKGIFIVKKGDTTSKVVL